MLRFKSFDTATSIILRLAVMHMIKKEQINLRDQSVQNQKAFIHQLLGFQHKVQSPLGGGGVAKTYIKVKGQWMYLYRAVDSRGNTIDFFLSKIRDQKAAKRFFKKALRSFHVSKPRVITVDKNPARNI